MRWSIRTKIMMVLSALLLFVVIAYLVLAERVFREDKELLVFDTNRSSNQQVATEIETSLRRIADKLEVLAQLAANPAHESRALASSFFEEDPDLLLFQLVQSKGKVLQELVSDRKLRTLRLDSKRLHAPEILETPAHSLDGLYIDNRSIPEAALFLVRIPIRFKNSLTGKTAPQAYVQAIIDGHSTLERFRQNQGFALSFVVTSAGRVYVHPHIEEVLSRRDLQAMEPVRQAMSQDFAVQQMEFAMDGKHYLGIYQKTAVGSLIVVSMTDKAAALAARGLLLEKTLYLSIFIFTIVFLISLLFANTLTTPLLRLVKATREIAHGNFDTPISVDTGDEIGVLALSFSEMGRELKSSRVLLEQYNAELEDKVILRTRELEDKNVDIRKQQEALLRATRLAAVGEIAGQAAHEVLNPLTAMISRLEAVSTRVVEFSDGPTAPLPALQAIVDDWDKDYQEGGIARWMAALEKPSTAQPGKRMADEDLHNLGYITGKFRELSIQLRADLDLLLRESHRIGRIVDGMRGLSRSSKIKTRTDIVALISDCVRVSEDLLVRHKIRIETQYDAQPVFVHLDTDEMRQVFSNLIKNAMDAIVPVIAQRGRGLIQIRVTLSGLDQVKIRIRDNGSGIRPEDLLRMFEADFSTKGAEGTGFGLSICRRFVRSAGGELLVLESVAGEFTELEITLPTAPLTPILQEVSH